eukprot:TRINITY_DN8309_c0_g1_i1.p1 TRINITY_DN8309_c0_g1~~TRINITY_DN8309_c0_g1_i1.p1  ORF type:complete len:254 (+),score=39.11 TRINITY_DN8309_c0_g1_i1:39-800(+)
MAVIIARHGERVDLSDPEGWMSNEQRLIRPWDPTLTANGKRQARTLGSRIREEVAKLDLPQDIKVFSSPFTRTVETAHGVIQGLEDDSLKIHTEPGLIEGICDDWYSSWCYPESVGHWGGPANKPAEGINKHAHLPLSELVRTPAQLQSLVSDAVCTEYKQFTSIPNITISENLETFPSCFSRVSSFIEKLHSLHPSKTVVCISHGAPLTGMYNHLSGEDSSVWTEYCGLYVFKAKDTGFQLLAEGHSHTAEN